MKKIKILYSIVLLLSAMLLINNGCTDLEEEILDEAKVEDLLADPNSVSALINPAYAQLRALYQFWNAIGLQEAASDEAMFPTRGTDWDDGGQWRALHQHTWDANHGIINNAWNGLSGGVAKSNIAIQVLEQAEATAVNKQFLAEVRFLRAYYSWFFLDLFGQVPFRESTDDDYLEPGQILNATDAFNFIESELLAIIPDLGEKPDLPYGRISKQAAQTLLAKLYLNKAVYTGSADWAKAIQQCDAVIGSNLYALTADYFNMFKVDNQENYDITDEAIFVAIYDSQEDLGENIPYFHYTLHYSQDFGKGYWPWNGAVCPQDFFLTIDTANDLRYQDFRNYDRLGVNQGFLIGQQYDETTGDSLFDRNGNPLSFTVECPLFGAKEYEGIRVLKYEPDIQDGKAWEAAGSNDYIIFRIADVYLMRAEAKIRNGQSGDADINAVRTIRGLSALSSATLDDVLLERGHELYWEGHRRTDQIRFGTWNGTWHEKPASPAHTKLYPIPQNAVALNPNLNQNPGY